MKIYIYIILSVFVLSSCVNKNPITDGETIYVEKFLDEGELKSDSLNFIRSVGFYGCEVKYPYLFLNLFNQDKFAAVYDLENQKFVGDFFTKGKSKDEYMDFCMLNENEGSLFWALDPLKRYLGAFTFEQHGDSCVLVKKKELTYKVAGDMFSLFVKDSSVYVYKSFSDKKGLYYRNCENNIDICPYNKNLRKNDLNRMLTLADGLKEDGKKIVSLTGIWNQIEIVSTDGTGKNLSITTSDRNMTWDEYKSMDKDALVDYYISMPRCNNEYIAVLHNNLRNHEFLFFDWDGNGIARYSIAEYLIDFSIDWNNMVIYGITSTEKVYKYKVPRRKL